MKKIHLYMAKISIGRILILSFFISVLIQCKNDDQSILSPENLVITVDIDSDGSGHVVIDAEAENVKYFKFFFGEEVDELPVKTANGLVSYTYKESGTYTIKVQAHADESIFISDTKTIDVSIFIPIPATGYTTPDTYAGMNLLWSDEFNGNSVDETKWVFEIGNNGGWGNNELEYYKSENASIQEGNLMIEAKSEAFGGKSYTSTRMITKGKFDFKYGRVDIRAALPKGQGIWPALWLLGANIDAVGWPKCGEIDIMEMIGGGEGRDNKVYGTAHWDNAGSYANYGGNYTLPSGIFNSEFHVFSITWDASYIRWYMDDIKYHEILTTPEGLSEFQEPYFIIFNIAVGGNWPGNPDTSTKFPQRMFVDYIRVFQPQ